MLDDILEEFTPTEVITIVVEREYKIKRELVKQIFEIPVLVIRNTGKAILVTKKDGSSWANGKKGEALWLPSFAMDSLGSKKYKIRYDKIDSKDFDKFVNRFGYEPLQESLNEGLVERTFSDEELRLRKPFKVILKVLGRDRQDTKKRVLKTYEFEAHITAHTEKAVCLKIGGKSFWVPLFVIKRYGTDVILDRPKMDSISMMAALRVNNIKPKIEPFAESTMLSFTEFLLEKTVERMNTSIRKKLNDAFSSKNFGMYFATIPFEKIEDILASYGYFLSQEDGTPWEGMISGKSGKTLIDVSKISNKLIVQNTQLSLSWYKTENNKYEVTVYLT